MGWSLPDLKDSSSKIDREDLVTDVVPICGVRFGQDSSQAQIAR
jgi:hypothetical protein